MKIAFHTLGCKVNQYESEAIAAAFEQQGYTVVDEREFADVYVINTCTVTAVADKKSRQYIRRMKKVNPDSVVVVTGCYAQISPEEVSAVDGVDIVAGTNEKSHLTDYVAEFQEHGMRQLHVKGYEELDVYDETGLVVNTENRTRAYINIQEGCNRFCSYCVIPYARGKVRSRGLSEIVAEAEKLITGGYREIVLTGINTALYEMEQIRPDEAGRLPEEPYGVEKVIAALSDIPGDFRIRLSSLEPAVVDADYVKRLLKYDKLCHHLHLSAQSGSSQVLAAMNRPYDREAYITKAASMKGHVAPQVKNRRSDRLHDVGKKSAEAFFAENKGRMERVLLEELLEDQQMITGYTGNYIKVYVPYEDPEAAQGMLNQFVSVELLEVCRDGMRGRMVERRDQL